MRVISGKAKGRRLRPVPGDTTRPITDRVKENLFNILGDWVLRTRWLDLFAGTGQVGIEALSRGAEHVVFVDKARAAILTVRKNLEITALSRAAHVIQTDAFHYLSKPGPGRFDVIYVAPPQYHGLWKEVVSQVDEQPAAFLAKEGMVIVQIDPKEFEELELRELVMFDHRLYGNTMLCFYEFSSPTNNSMTH